MSGLQFLVENSIGNIYHSELEIIKEGVGEFPDLYIKGIFLQGNMKNKNERIYPTDMLSESVNKYSNTKVVKNRALGELNHPPGVDINLKNVSHRITELNMIENNGMGKALILNTPTGHIVRGLTEGGCDIGVSTRGLGKLDQNKDGIKVVSEYDLVTIDIVAEPSAPDAYIEAVNEGLNNYVKQSASKSSLTETDSLEKVCRVLEEIKEGLTVLPKKQVDKDRKFIDIIKRSIDKL